MNWITEYLLALGAFSFANFLVAFVKHGTPFHPSAFERTYFLWAFNLVLFFIILKDLHR
jgi:hypothetical protein